MGAWAIAPPSLVGRKLVVIDKTLARLSNISASCGGLVSSVAADAQVEGTCGKGMVLVITRHLPAKVRTSSRRREDGQNHPRSFFLRYLEFP